MASPSVTQRHPYVVALLIGAVAALGAVALDLVIGSKNINWYTLALGAIVMLAVLASAWRGRRNGDHP